MPKKKSLEYYKFSALQHFVSVSDRIVSSWPVENFCFCLKCDTAILNQQETIRSLRSFIKWYYFCIDKYFFLMCTLLSGHINHIFMSCLSVIYMISFVSLTDIVFTIVPFNLCSSTPCIVMWPIFTWFYLFYTCWAC